jgi:uncharacterized protein (TIGR02001 family)
VAWRQTAGQWLTALTIIGAAGPACAAEWGGSLALTSDYVFRGVSRSDDGAMQAGLNVRSSERWFASAWASSLPRSPAGRVELNLQVGRGWDLADDWAVSAGWLRYLYPRADSGRYDWDELSATLAYGDRGVLVASLSPNMPQFYGAGVAERRRAGALELSWREPIGGPWSLAAAAGRYGAASRHPYSAGSLGLATQLDRVEVSLTRFAVDAAGRRQFGRAADARWALSLVWRYAVD